MEMDRSLNPGMVLLDLIGYKQVLGTVVWKMKVEGDLKVRALFSAEFGRCLLICYMSKKVLMRWSPNFLTPWTIFVEDNFSMNRGGRMVSGRFKCITFTVHFISIMMTPAPPQIIRHLVPEVRDSC